ncbi:MAG TPA: TonB-dependent receptor [Steroidobacteraceae bacterium]|nr:TonB-dependent receptor [Steroidobacteraceae bacterium]
MNKFAVHSARAAAFAASLFAVPPVLAQDAPVSIGAMGLEEVTVTARRREESLRDVPIAVSAFSAERIEATGAPDITWLQQTTPNLTLQVARGTNSTLVSFIRGIGQQDPLWGFEPGVGLYVDDVYIARPQGAVLDIYDIERLEVLRGPQGTLYGRNTIGGAIKYVTRPLGDQPRLDVKYTLGSYAQHDVLASGVLPLGDTFSVGASAAIYRRDGYGDNKFTAEDHYAKDVEAYRLSADWRPSEDVSVRIAADTVIDDSPAKHGHREVPGAGLTTGEVVLDDIYDTRGGAGSDNRVMTEGVAMTVAWNIDETLTFKSITAYRKGETDTLIDFDSSPQPALDIPGAYADDQTSQEFQLLFEGDRWQGVAGLYYLDASASGAFDTPVGLLGATTFTDGYVDTTSYAAFADVSYSFTDRLRASLGGRYTRDEKEGSVYRADFLGLGSPYFTNVDAAPLRVRTDYTNERTFDKFTPRASVSFDFSDSLTTYASYSEGFKSGGFDMRGDAIFTPDTVNGYDPENVKSFELGLKGSAWDGRATYNLAAFYSDYTDQQITRQEPTATGVASFVDNAGSSTIQGVELEGAVAFTDQFSLTYGIGWTDAEFDEYASFTVVSGTPVPIDYADIAHFQNTPEWNGNVALTYLQPLAPNWGSLATVVSASYRDSYYMFEFDRPLIDQTTDYTLIDASITWTSASDRFRVQLSGRNLTDEEYKVGGYDFYTDYSAATQALFGNTVTSFYGPPRTYSVSLSYRFD